MRTCLCLPAQFGPYYYLKFAEKTGTFSPGFRVESMFASLSLEELERHVDQQGSAGAGTAPRSAASSLVILPTRSFMQDQEQWAPGSATLGDTHSQNTSEPLPLSLTATTAGPGAASGSPSSSLMLVLRRLVYSVHSLPQSQLIRLCHILQRLQESVALDPSYGETDDLGHSDAKALGLPQLLPELLRHLTAAMIKGMGAPAASSPQDLYIVLKVGENLGQGSKGDTDLLGTRGPFYVLGFSIISLVAAGLLTRQRPFG